MARRRKGRRVSGLRNSALRRCVTYDAFGRVVEETTPGQAVLTYDLSYDAWGQRIVDVYGSPGSGYDADEIMTILPGGRWVADYNENNVRGTYFQHPDALGSVTEWSDQNGNLTVNQLFYPFGQSWIGQPGGGAPTQFAGMEHRNAYQFDVTPNREYNSKWGRWLTPDPGGKNAVRLDDPQTWNMYSYVRNNPTTLTDPTGLYEMNPGSLSAIQAGEQALGAENEQEYLAYEFSGGSTAAESSSSTGQSQKQGQQGQGEDQAQKRAPDAPPSWDKNKPLPDDPSKLGPDWKKNPNHKDPNGEEYVNDKTGEKIEWNKGQPGEPGNRGKDHWHYTPPGGERGREHFKPGETVTKVGVGVAVVGAIRTAVQAIIESAPEWIPLLATP